MYVADVIPPLFIVIMITIHPHLTAQDSNNGLKRQQRRHAAGGQQSTFPASAASATSTVAIDAALL